MSKEYNKWLCSKYPWLCPYNVITGSLPKDYDYEYTWLDFIPEGWRNNFGLKLCEEIQSLLIEANFENKYKIIQIKEKYGSLRWYSEEVPISINKRYDDLIDKYEDLSKKICIFCGQPANLKLDGWVIPLCDKCYDEYENKRVITGW